MARAAAGRARGNSTPARTLSKSAGPGRGGRAAWNGSGRPPGARVPRRPPQHRGPWGGTGGGGGGDGGIPPAGSPLVEVRWAWRGGRGRKEWSGTRPGGQRALVPPTALRPLARGGRQGEEDAPAGAAPAVPRPPPPAGVLVP